MVTTFYVSSAAELKTAVSSASGGDTIALASGTYDPVDLGGISVQGQPITITSADPGHPAELTKLHVTNSSGLAFSHLTFTDSDPTANTFDFQVSKSSNISFDHIDAHGVPGVTDQSDTLLFIRSSSQISVTQSEFSNTRYALAMLDDTGVTLTGNYFHDIRTDGIRGGGVSDITISDNVFTDFKPVLGDHPDAIQFWTTNTTTSAENITITDNVIMRGDGEAMQGIFMGDEVGNLPYQNVNIDGNLVVGGMYNGIAVANADDLSVTNNVVAGYEDMKSWIRVPGDTEMSGNVSQALIVDGKSVSPTGTNGAVSAVADGGLALFEAWAAGHDPSAYNLAALQLVNIGLGTEPVGGGDHADAPGGVEPVVTQITGTDGNDNLKPQGDGHTVISTGLGNDVLRGGAGWTEMHGGAGDDGYIINSARDTVVEHANEGNDVVSINVDFTLPDNVEQMRMLASDLIGHGNALDNRMTGSSGSDAIYGEAGNDTLMGLGGDDHLYGGDGDDSLTGGDGNDHLYGEAGNDHLLGSNGDDWLDGGAGNDWIEGGSGNNMLTGGSGADTFAFRDETLHHVNTIVDFSSADGDKLALSLIDANTHVSGNDPFHFIGSQDFSHSAGELRYTDTADGLRVEGDVDGDGVADLTIILQGVHELARHDIVL